MTELKAIPGELIFDLSEKGWLHFEEFGLSIRTSFQTVQVFLEGYGKAQIEPEKITLDKLEDLSESDSELFFHGTILGIYDLFQGRFPLHASAVSLEGNSCLFTGQSGAGKSTHAAYFLQQGYSLVSDDVSRIIFDDLGVPWIQPAIAQVKLWDDAVRHFGDEPDQLPTVPGRLDKRRLTQSISFVSQAIPARNIIHLVPIEEGPYSFRQLKGMEAYEVIAQNIYRGFVIPALGRVREHFAFCSKLAQTVPVFEVHRPKGHFVMEQVYHDLSHWMHSIEKK